MSLADQYSKLLAWAVDMAVNHGYQLVPMTDAEITYMLANDPEQRLQTCVENAWVSVGGVKPEHITGLAPIAEPQG